MSMSFNMRSAGPEELIKITADSSLQFVLGLEPYRFTDSSNYLSFFQDWHIIHYLFTDTLWDTSLPLGFILGGKDWHSWDPSHEPLKVLDSQLVKEISEALIAIDIDLILDRFKKREAVDSSGYFASIPETEFLSIMEEVEKITGFVSAAAECGQAIVKELG
ncbi:MAG: hypothetical protein ACI861_001708 [Paracoccaceae bacterium]|jgi:hypothetical protein